MEPRDYLSMALQRLDLLLQREILRLRASYQLSLDEFRGLYISDEQVNQLVNRAVNYEGPSSAIDELTEKAESLRAGSTRCDGGSPWQRLVAEFALSSIEQDLLLLAVAPEIDLKYETLFAYLNNDITRKWPTFGLALRVAAAVTEQRTEVRRCLLQEAKLFGSGLLQLVNAGRRSALVARHGFRRGAAGQPVSRKRRIVGSAPGAVRRAAKHVDRLAAPVYRRRSRKRVAQFLASHGRCEIPLAGGGSCRSPGRRTGAGG